MTALSCQVVVLSTPGYNSMVETDRNNLLATREREKRRARTRENIIIMLLAEIKRTIHSSL